MRWATAVKQWNEHKKSVNPAHVYCLPRKGTPEHAEVSKLMASHKKDVSKMEAAKPSTSSKEEPKGGASGGEKKMPRAVLEEYLAGFEKRKAELEASKGKREAEEKERAAARKEKEHKRALKEVETVAKRRKALAAKKEAAKEAAAEEAEGTSRHNQISEGVTRRFLKHAKTNKESAIKLLKIWDRNGRVSVDDVPADIKKIAEMALSKLAFAGSKKFGDWEFVLAPINDIRVGFDSSKAEELLNQLTSGSEETKSHRDKIVEMLIEGLKK
jgi:hypothetical protein